MWHHLLAILRLLLLTLSRLLLRITIGRLLLLHCGHGAAAVTCSVFKQLASLGRYQQMSYSSDVPAAMRGRAKSLAT
jgi:hypothetical protein